MKTIMRYMAVFAMLMSFTAMAAKPPLPYFPEDFELNKKPPKFDMARWKGRMGKVWSNFEGVSKKFPGMFKDLTERQKRCLAAHIAFLQADLYRQFVSPKAPMDVVSSAREDVEYYRTIMNQYCNPRDPGVRIYEVYLAEFGKENVKWTLTKHVEVQNQETSTLYEVQQGTQTVILLVILGIIVVGVGAASTPVLALP